MVIFNRQEWETRLSALSQRARVAFAVGCAARTYERNASTLDSETREVVSSALRSVCGAWLAHRLAADELVGASAALELCPRLDEDAVASTAYVLRSIASGSSRDAMWAAERAYNAMDALAQESLRIAAWTPESERAVAASPEVQQELERQTGDLELLERDVENGRRIISQAMHVLGG